MKNSNCKIILIVTLIFTCSTFVACGQEKVAHYYNPQWSPDGQKIVFESDKDGESAIYTITINGSELKKLTFDASSNFQPRWSPNGQQIVFVSNQSGKSQVHIMNSDGSNRRQITKDTVNNYVPDLSKTNKLVYASMDIFIIDLDGSNQLQLTDGSGDYESPRWSPDGKFILFVKSGFIPKEIREKFPGMTREERQKVLSERDKTNEILVMNANGSDVRNLTNNNSWDYDAQWSKDGRTIYFLSRREGGFTHVFAMNADGSNVRRIADGAIVKGTGISPDELYILYSKKTGNKYGIYVYDIKAGKERLLTGG